MKSSQKSSNTLVFTTKFVMHEQKLITYVAHDMEDGGWQFLSDDEIPNMQDLAMLVTYAQILKVDPTLSQISDLKPGYCAIRADLEDKWKIEKI